ncbi:MAG: DUF4058 family protein [Isosphaeraceae bacterium]
MIIKVKSSDLYLDADHRGSLMPIHDWTRVSAGIFHHFHQRWIGAITDVLNERLLPGDYYALAEQQGAGFEPDVLTLKTGETPMAEDEPAPSGMMESSRGEGWNGAARGSVLAAQPRVRITAETDLDFYRRKQNVAAVRHVSGDRLIAIVEIVSKGNKAGRKAFDDFVRKAAEFLSRQVHLLILDLQPPTARDPQGMHGAVWDEFAGKEYVRPPEKSLTLAAYDAGSSVRAYIEPVSVGDPLIDMPLFLSPGHYVAVPLEETYSLAFAAVPRRWRSILEAK